MLKKGIKTQDNVTNCISQMKIKYSKYILNWFEVIKLYLDIINILLHIT